MKKYRWVGASLALSALAGCPTSAPTERIVEHEQQSIGATGGSVTLPDNGSSVQVPSGALASPVDVGVSELSETAVATPPASADPVSPPVALTPHGQQFLVPVSVSIPYAGPSTGLQLLRLDDEADTTWEVVAGVAFADGVATFETMHFSVVEVVRDLDVDGGLPFDGSASDGGRTEDGAAPVDAYVGPAVDAYLDPTIDAWVERFDAGAPTEDVGAIGEDASVPPVDSGASIDAGAPVDAYTCLPSTEACNAMDDDCDDLVDEEFACGGEEHCNGVDDDLDGLVDETPVDSWIGRTCGRNVGACRVGVGQCVAGHASCVGAIEPATEACPNGLDDDCNGAVDDCPVPGVDSGVPPTCDADGDGFVPSTMCGMPPLDCDDADFSVNPGEPELCRDATDQDCDGLVDEGCPVCLDGDLDGFGVGSACTMPEDCDDTDATISPGNPDLCGDGIDNDCDGMIDNVPGVDAGGAC